MSTSTNEAKAASLAKSHPAMVWTGRIITLLVGIAFGMSGVMKFKGGPELTEGMQHLGLSESMVLPLGVLELTCVVLYLIPPTAILGAVLLTGYIGGAICTHWRVGDPFYVQIGIGILIWLGPFLRDRRLRDLLPIRR